MGECSFMIFVAAAAPHHHHHRHQAELSAFSQQKTMRRQAVGCPSPAQPSPAQPSPGQLQLEWEPSRGWQVESAAAWRQQSAWLPNEILTAAGNSQLAAASHRGFLFSLLPPVQSWGQIVMAHGGMADWYCYCWLHSGGFHWNVCFQFWTHQVDIA